MAPSPALAPRPQWEEDEDASTLGHDGDDEYDDAPALDRAPVHPIACMQGAFEESIIEAEETEQEKVKPKRAGGAKARRQRMLDEEDYNESYNAQWRKKPSAKYHPLWKLVAQISFGVHLLNQQLAKSDEEVSRILKTHVQEVDQFLEKTTEDFDLALADIQERINHLKLPLEHVNIFDIMLDDRKFRTSIIEGNEKIEKIVERTARAMNDSLVDVEKGMEATEELSHYLDRIGASWAEGDEELIGIYMAMCGNSEGWLECLRNLQAKGNELGVALVQLGSILNEMTKRAGVASRRSIIAHRTPDTDSRPGSRSTSRSTPRTLSRQSSRPRLASPPDSAWASPRGTPLPGDKPLPRAPDSLSPSVAATLHRSQSRPPQKAHTIPLEQRFEHPRPPPRSPRNMNGVAQSPTIPQKDKRRQKAPEPRLETPIPPEWASRGTTPDGSRATTPNSRSPARSPAHSPSHSPAQPPSRSPAPAPAQPVQVAPRSPNPSSIVKTPSSLRKKLSVRGGREKPSSPMVDSAYSSGSGSSRSSDNERKAAASPAPAQNPSSRPGTSQTHNLSSHKFGLFPPSSPATPALSIRSGVTGSTLSKTNTLNTNDSRPSTAVTRPSTSASNYSTGSGIKRRSSLAGLRNIFRRKHSANKLGPTMESPAE